MPASYDGHWQGTWSLSDDSAAGNLSMSLDHAGDRVSGSVDIGGTLCIGSANVDATVGAGGLSGTFTNSIGGVVEIDGDVGAGDEFSGTFTVKSGLCSGSQGSFTMHH